MINNQKKIKKVLNSCYILINPSRFPNHAKYIRKVLKLYDASAVVLTESREDFIHRVQNFYHSKDFQYLLIWGGDGTAHLAVNTYFNEKLLYPEEFSPEKAIGFMRGGSGNGIQDSYEVPIGIFKQIDSYVESMKNNYTIRNDLLKIETDSTVHYGQLFGLGMDSSILSHRNKRVFRSGRRKGEIKPGLFNYLRSILNFFPDGTRKFSNKYEIKIENGKYIYFGSRVNAQVVFKSLTRHISVPQIVAGTRPYYAKFFKICPHVICNDGLLDVYIYNFRNKSTVLFNIGSLYRGNHVKINNRLSRKDKPIIEHYKAESLSIKVTNPLTTTLTEKFFQLKETGICTWLK